MRTWTAALVVALGTVVACDDNNVGIVTTDEVTPDTGGAPTTGVCSDAQIAAIVIDANDSEVVIAQTVRERLVTSQARAIADRIIADHTRMSDDAAEIAATLGVLPEETSLSQAVSDEAGATVGDLLPLSGIALDRAFMTAVVLDHTGDLGLIDNLLLPSASADLLRQGIRSQRAVIAEHLRLALEAQTEIQGSCGSL
jgi:putative membrane protein